MDNAVLAPPLRFPEFSDPWKLCMLGNLVELQSGFAYSSELFTNKGLKLVTPKNFTKSGFGEFNSLNTKFTSEITAAKYLCSAGDLLILLTDLTPSCELLGKPLELKPEDGDVLLNQRIVRVDPDNLSIVSGFLKGFFLTDNFHKRIVRTASGTTVRHSSNKIVSKTTIRLPHTSEQQKIASFLTSVDEKIQKLTHKQALLEQYKKGVMQKLFSQEIRFKADDGSNFPDWKKKRLGEVLQEHKLKSTGSEIVFSVSVHKGLVNQIEHLGRSFSAKNTGHYNRVKLNDIVYTKSPTGQFPLGIIKQSKVARDVIVSPLYGVFAPETPALGFILHVYFESSINVGNYLRPIVQKGAKNTISVTNNVFLSNKLKLPVSFDEQKKIAAFLLSLDEKINATADQLSQMQSFKKGLLQQMFV